MKIFVVILGALVWFSLSAFADDELIDGSDREPAAVAPINVNKRTYPGGQDEEDLQVQGHLPSAGLKTNARGLQRGVYKNLYNQEMKEERSQAVEE